MKLCGYVVLREEDYIESLERWLLRGIDVGCKATAEGKVVLYFGNPIRRNKNQEELKPCPFCGSKDLKIRVYHNVSGAVYLVHCYRCGANGPDYCDNKHSAINAWNKRS